MKEKIKLLIKQIGVILALVVIIIILTITSEKANKIELTQLSSQGESQMMGYLIKTKNNKVIAIDGGTVDDVDNFIYQVKQLGGKIDIWFLTHPHKDHVGVFNVIAQERPEEIEIGTIYYTANSIQWYQQNDEIRFFEAENFYNSLEKEGIKEKAKEVNLNQQIDIDNIKCEILGIKNPEIITNPFNNSSMIIKIKANEKFILFLGDTGIEGGMKLLETQKENLKADIVQIAHHGQAGVTEEIYQIIKPQICLWPTPKWLWENDLGEGYNTSSYQTITTREWIEKLNVKQNIVAKDGDITIQI